MKFIESTWFVPALLGVFLILVLIALLPVLRMILDNLKIKNQKYNRANRFYKYRRQNNKISPRRRSKWKR